MLYNRKDIERQVNELGFLPFFAGEIEGFSIEENLAREHWFPDEGDGVWDWKNDIIIDGDCAYGKLYMGKACFVSMEWYPDLVNWRRANYRPNANEQLILDTVVDHGSLLSRDIKKLCGFQAPPRRRHANPLTRLAAADEPKPKPERRGFDTALTHLQMGCRLLSANFEYSYTRTGERYGWSVARYCTPEEFFGPERMAVPHTPAESRARLLDHLHRALPQASDLQIDHIIA